MTHFTPKQTASLAFMIDHINENLQTYSRYGAEITNITVEDTDYGVVWIGVTTELTGLPAGNLLRALHDGHWFFQLGKRGGVKLFGGPKSYQQFRGRMAFGRINVQPDLY